jgi:hypothetical protein
VNFLVGEGIDRQIVECLRQERLRTLYVAKMVPGLSGEGILDKASQEKALLLTADLVTRYF